MPDVEPANQVRVGSATAPIAEAQAFVTRYLTTPSDDWSYPAYDEYPGGPSDLVSEQDLFGPTLLNAGITKLSVYYAFCQRLDDINDALGDVPTETPLARATASEVAAVARLIGVLDRPIRGIRLTKFSKVLHRKRPQIIPLYDKHIQACYQNGTSAPVPVVPGRSMYDFAVAWLAALQHDLLSQEDIWPRLAALTPSEGPRITPLRALDIVGWGLGQPGKTKWARFAQPDAGARSPSGPGAYT